MDEDKKESMIEEAISEIDEPSSFSPSFSKQMKLGDYNEKFNLPRTKYNHAYKMDSSAIKLIVLFAVIISIALLASFFCASDKDSVIANVLDICKTVIVALLGYVFGSRTLEKGKNN
jgi:hypothetical protein